MPDELPDYGQEGKSFIVVLPQTLVQFNAILVETSLSADDQLQQFFQIYQCIKTTLTVNRPKKTLSNLHYFLSQLEEFKKYMLTFTKKPKGFVSSSSQSVHRHTRSEARKHLTITYIPKTPTADSSSVHTENDSLCNNAAGNTSDDDELESPKKNQDNSFLSTLDDGSPDKADDTNPEESTNQTSCLSETVKATQKCSVTNETRSNIHDKTFKRLSHKKKVSKELPTECLTEEKPPVSANEKREKKTHILSIKNKEKQKRKMVTSIESDGSTTSKQVVEKAIYKMENGKYVCEQCSYNTTRKYNIQRHIFKHSDLPVCRICNTKFMDSIHLINHMVTVHGQGGDARACCSVCGETFLSLNALRKHKQFVHLRKAKYHCKACDMFFDSRSRFDAHMSKHTGVAPHCCGKCGKGYRFKKNLLHHSMICTGKNVSYEKKDGRLHCRECGYITKWYTDIKRHWYQHNPENKHACSHCEKLYCSVLELQEHVNTAHLNLKFLCYGCGKKFNSRRALNRHASHAHENVYKYTCEVCAKRFYDKVKFDDHKDKHTGSKNHICHVCGLAYRYKPRLITHLKMHTSSENFLCNICEQRFNTMASLKNHMIGKHSIDHCYRCPWCSKEFKWSSSLSFHKRKTCQFQPNI